jgi:TonB-dependent receptor
LPNLDLVLAVSDDWRVRLDASRTLTRPRLIDLTPVLQVPQNPRVGALTATGGNPNLQPFLSDNLDLGVEWYYAPNSYVSAGAFVKEVTNFIIQGTTTQTINGVIDPTTGNPAQFAVTQLVNGPSAEVRGLELAIQHVFADTGFGFQVNATKVDTNKPYDASVTSTSGFAVTGLADSANVVGFYEKHGFETRVALNWRDEYLDHFGQQQNGGRFGTEPTFVNASTTVDFSTSYRFGSNFDVYFEALNLTDETFSTHGRFEEQVLDVVDFGRRYTLGFHFRL